MRIKPLAEAKAQFSAIVAESREPVLVTRNGRPAMMLVPVPQDVDIEELALVFSPKFRAIMRRAEEQIARGEGIPAAEARRLVLGDEAQ
jgi:prevent-host-death family protein